MNKFFRIVRPAHLAMALGLLTSVLTGCGEDPAGPSGPDYAASPTTLTWDKLVDDGGCFVADEAALTQIASDTLLDAPVGDSIVTYIGTAAGTLTLRFRELSGQKFVDMLRSTAPGSMLGDVTEASGISVGRFGPQDNLADLKITLSTALVPLAGQVSADALILDNIFWPSQMDKSVVFRRVDPALCPIL